MTTPIDTLAFLQEQFAAIPSRTVEVPGFPVPLVFQPLNPEQTLKLAKAIREPRAAMQAAAYAELIVETVRLEDGTQAFTLVKGGANPVEVLTKQTPAKIFTGLVNRLIDWVTTDGK